MGCRLLFFLFFLVIFDLQGLDVLQPDSNAELQGRGDVFPPGVRGGGLEDWRWAQGVQLQQGWQ